MIMSDPLYNELNAIDKIMAASPPKFILESTANGYNHFYKMWQASVKDKEYPQGGYTYSFGGYKGVDYPQSNFLDIIREILYEHRPACIKCGGDQPVDFIGVYVNHDIDKLVIEIMCHDKRQVKQFSMDLLSNMYGSKDIVQFLLDQNQVAFNT